MREGDMATAIDVAKYMIIRAMKDEDPITNMKVQKLCYYALGVYSKLSNGKKLFNENVEAWQHGPVVREVYKEYARKSNGITIPDDYSDLSFNNLEQKAVDITYTYFSQYSAWRLREMTHAETPWKRNYEESKKNIIPFEDIKSFFDKSITIN